MGQLAEGSNDRQSIYLEDVRTGSSDGWSRQIVAWRDCVREEGVLEGIGVGDDVSELYILGCFECVRYLVRSYCFLWLQVS